jgi:hypothetical protein
MKHILLLLYSPKEVTKKGCPVKPCRYIRASLGGNSRKFSAVSFRIPLELSLMQSGAGFTTGIENQIMNSGDSKNKQFFSLFLTQYSLLIGH